MENIVVQRSELSCCWNIHLIHPLIMAVAPSFLIHFTKVWRAYATYGRFWLAHLCILRKGYVMTTRNVLREVFLQSGKESESHLCSDCDWGYGPMIHLLGGVNAWSEVVPWLLHSCKSSRSLWNRGSPTYYNPGTPLMGSTAIPPSDELSEVSQKSLCRS